ncbi:MULTISPECIES: hypothetical protein [Streptomyces]|uniref:Uncharacterized protein n=1 Tax=Streptomyces cheonanensis TaxID=312720 RepID=A0ABP5GVJ7_9ACTN|nr:MULTISPECIES: hypothetical protein [Streptomyces]MCK1816863.1 hypothetical protein [Streptomyces sp. XM4011]QKV71059.1 hypothetical protein HUT13_21550 [Streptomyces harbinensis]
MYTNIDLVRERMDTLRREAHRERLIRAARQGTRARAAARRAAETEEEEQRRERNVRAPSRPRRWFRARA